MFILLNLCLGLSNILIVLLNFTSDSYAVYAFVSDCNTPPTSPGVTSNFTTTTHGSSVEYSCNYGYEAAGGETILECDSGVWIGTLLTCSLIGKKLNVIGNHRP